nr:hypothetical protein [Tanacetum cinerariifolium]
MAVSIVSCGTHHILHKKYCLFLEDNQTGSLVYMPVVGFVLLVDRLLDPLLHLVEQAGHPIVEIFIKKVLLVLRKLFLYEKVFPPFLSSSSQSLSSSASFRIVNFPGVTSSSKNYSPQPVAVTSSMGVVFMERSTSMVAIIYRLSSHLVSRRTTKTFVPALLRCSACSFIMNIPSCFKSSIVVVSSENSSCCSSHLMSVSGHLSVATDLIFLSWKLCLCLRRASVEDARPSGSHFFDSLSNCSLKILLGSSKTCIFPSDLFTRSLPLMEKLSSLLAKLDIQLLPLDWQDSSGDELLDFVAFLLIFQAVFLVAMDLIFLSWKLCLCLRRASVEDARPSRSHFFDSLSNCSLKILLGSSKTCIFPSDLFTRILPLMEKLSSLLAKLDIESL